MKQPRNERLRTMIRNQEKWIEERGGTLEAYIRRYGEPGTEECYGDGGRAIYVADTNELNRLKILLDPWVSKFIC